MSLFRTLSRLFGAEPTPPASAGPDPLAKLATLNDDLSRPDRNPAPPESEVEEQAYIIGKAAEKILRSEHWTVDPHFGPCLSQLGQHGAARFYPFLLLAKKRELGPGLDLAVLMERLPRKLEEEDALYAPFPSVHPQPEQQITALQRWFEHRFGHQLPLSLVGVRTLDGFLRTQYFLRHIDTPHCIAAGFYVGEVARGLFGGEWRLAPEGPTRHALHYPELDYLPVGRVFKLMAECPEGDALDEYIRLVPSARRSLKN